MKNLILILAGIFILILFSGCIKENSYPIVLPNDYSALGEKVQSKTNIDSYNILSREENLINKSRIEGTITYLGTIDVGDNSVSINNVEMNSEGGNGGLLAGGGNGINNLDIFDNGGIFLKLKTSLEKEFLMQIKSYKNNLSPVISLEYLKVGQKISFPTIREYEHHSCGCSGKHVYRILNNPDYIYLHEINKVQ